MKIPKLLILLFFISDISFAQCYSKIVSYSRSYIALQTDGTIWSKGTNLHRRLLGFGDVTSPAEFSQIGTENNWTENISINNINVFAIRSDGTLWVWGRNSTNGSAGLGTFDDLDYITPTKLGNDTNWAKVSAGDGFTIALKTDGTLWAWGSNDRGSLGLGNPDDSYKTNTPIQVGTDTNWSNIFTGFTKLAYAIKTDGTLWSWGNNGIFLGYPDSTINNNYRTPKQVGTDTWKTMDMVWNGPMISGIKKDGTLWAWGNSNGGTSMFANGVTAHYFSYYPVQIGTDSDWKEISMYQLNTQALKANGTRWGWGYNSIGCELGMGTGQAANVVFPTQLDLDNDWKTIWVDINEGEGSGIKQTNTLYHWGGTNQNTTFPVPTLFSISNCTLGTNDFESYSISTYPNPVTDYLNIRFQININNVELSLYNQLGQKLTLPKTEIVNQKSTLNMSNLASGVYFLSVKTNGKLHKIKIIKN